VGRAQLRSRVDPPVLPSQPFAVEEVATREVDAHASLAKPFDRFAVEPLGVRSLAQERTRPGLDSERPFGSADAGRLGEPSVSSGGEFGHPAPGRCFDQLDHAPGRRTDVRGVFAGPLGSGESFLVAAETVVQQGARPLDDGYPDSFAPEYHLLLARLDHRRRLGL